MPEVKKRVAPLKLSDAQKEKIVEEYLGAHPKYFIYGGLQITLDIWRFEHDGNNWEDWLPHKKELGE